MNRWTHPTLTRRAVRCLASVLLALQSLHLGFGEYNALLSGLFERQHPQHTKAGEHTAEGARQ